MRIAALGRTRMLWNTLQTLQTSGHQVALIATCKAAPEYEIREKDFEQFAKDIGANFLCTQNLNRLGDVLFTRSLFPILGEFLHPVGELFQAIAKVVGILRFVAATDRVRFRDIFARVRDTGEPVRFI